MKILLKACWICFLALFIIGCVGTKEGNPSEEIIDGQNKGTQIIQALGTYFDRLNEYPDSLETLIPIYIREIPKTNSGTNFAYKRSENDIHYLSFPIISNKNIGTGTVCTYIRRLEVWDCSQSFE